MVNLQYLRIISILGSLAVGFWIPLRLVGMRLDSSVDLACDLLISIISLSNIYLYFSGSNKKVKELSSWLNLNFLLDVICVLPLTFFDHLLFQTDAAWLYLLNLLAARHIFRIKDFLDEFDSIQPVLYRLVPIFVTMPLLVHLVACTWIALGSGTAGPDADKTMEYIRAVYWAFTTLTTVGYGDISAKTAPQMLFTCVVQVLGVGVFGFILSNVASLLSRLDAAREHHINNLDRVETFMKSHSIDDNVKMRVRKYYNYLWKTQRGYRDQTLLEELPEKMQSELFMCINKSILEKVPLFKGASLDFIEDLMEELQSKIVVPGERLFRYGENGDAMYFIQNGEFEILGKDNNLITHLRDGAFFGEMALVTDNSRNATAKSTTYSNVYMLSKEAFLNVIKLHPEFKANIEKVVKERTK